MEWLKTIHVSLALLSVSGFVIRVGLSFLESAWMGASLIRVLPHLIDSLLLLSGVVLAFHWSAAGLAVWLPYKILALVVYIFLGVMTFRLARTGLQKLTLAALALSSVIYLIGIALYKTPMSWFV